MGRKPAPQVQAPQQYLDTAGLHRNSVGWGERILQTPTIEAEPLGFRRTRSGVSPTYRLRFIRGYLALEGAARELGRRKSVITENG